MAEKNSIVLNMIVKNESKIIERCLKSVYHLIDSWCIVDTGSTDGTQEIIKNFLKDKPGKLIERPWVNFGHNRNEALEFASSMGDWILLTDADMVLIDNGFSKDELDINIDGYDVIQDNHGVRYDNFRILNAKRNWKCIGVTHEYYSPADGLKTRARLLSILFNDVSDGGSKGDKFERDIRLLEQGLIDEPNNPRYMFYLAQSYRDTENWEKAIHWYQQCHEKSNWDEESWFALYMVGWCMCRFPVKYKLDEIQEVLLRAWMLRPWRCEPIFQLGVIYKDSKKWEQAYQIFKSCATMDYPYKDLLFITSSLYEGASIDEFAVSCFWTRHFEESIKANEKLLESEYGKAHKTRIAKNIWFAEKELGNFSTENLFKFIEQKKAEVKETLHNKQLSLNI